MGTKMKTQKVINRAMKLRSESKTWKEVQTELKAEGFLTSKNKPYSQDYLCYLVASRRKKQKKGVKRAIIEREVSRITKKTNATEFKSFVKTAMVLNIPPAKKLDIINAALDSL